LHGDAGSPTPSLGSTCVGIWAHVLSVDSRMRHYLRSRVPSTTAFHETAMRHEPMPSSTCPLSVPFSCSHSKAGAARPTLVSRAVSMPCISDCLGGAPNRVELPYESVCGSAARAIPKPRTELAIKAGGEIPCLGASRWRCEAEMVLSIASFMRSGITYCTFTAAERCRSRFPRYRIFSTML
jgi:hypothetical protein